MHWLPPSLSAGRQCDTDDEQESEEDPAHPDEGHQRGENTARSVDPAPAKVSPLGLWGRSIKR